MSQNDNAHDRGCRDDDRGGNETSSENKTFACDFSKWTNERLRRELIFHENDRSTENVDEEYRRMFLVREITAELQRRGELLR